MINPWSSESRIPSLTEPDAEHPVTPPSCPTGGTHAWSTSHFFVQVFTVVQCAPLVLPVECSISKSTNAFLQSSYSSFTPDLEVDGGESPGTTEGMPLLLSIEFIFDGFFEVLLWLLISGSLKYMQVRPFWENISEYCRLHHTLYFPVLLRCTVFQCFCPQNKTVAFFPGFIINN